MFGKQAGLGLNRHAGLATPSGWFRFDAISPSFHAGALAGSGELCALDATVTIAGRLKLHAECLPSAEPAQAGL